MSHVIGAGILYGNGLDHRRVSDPSSKEDLENPQKSHFLYQGERTFNDLFKAVRDLNIIESQTPKHRSAVESRSADRIAWHWDDGVWE